MKLCDFYSTDWVSKRYESEQKEKLLYWKKINIQFCSSSTFTIAFFLFILIQVNDKKINSHVFI